MKFMIVALMGCLVVSCSKPEDELISRMEDIGEIMEDNMETPEEGVDELIAYIETYGAESSRLSAELAIELVSIEDGSDRKDRIKEVYKALSKEIKNLEGITDKFDKRVSKNDRAKERMDEFTEKWIKLQSLSISPRK